MNKPFNIYIISEDNVLNALLGNLLKMGLSSSVVSYYKSFSAVKSIEENAVVDLVILDDIITGSASHEIANILRQKKKIRCPVYYLSNAEYGEEKKALYSGATYFFKKPFNPEEIIQHIIEKTKTKIPE